MARCVTFAVARIAAPSASVDGTPSASAADRPTVAAAVA